MTLMAMHEESPPRQRGYATMEEASRYVRLSGRTLTKYISEGKLRAHQVGAKWLFDYADLDAFVKSA